MTIFIADTNRTPNKDKLFDRETLQFTVKLIRSHNPSLALRIQNLIAPSATPYIQYCTDPHAADQFKLNLDSYTLKRVVDTLAIAGQELAEQVLLTEQGDQSFLLEVKSSIGKWIAYARYHQNEYERINSNS
ncbi:MAG: hypothetical protein ACJA2Q_000472 [Pseudohongiellaceae bacterium]|jgi:hypothetical protein